MLPGLTILLMFQLIGEVVSYFTAGLVPGPVIGMALIFTVLTLTQGNLKLDTWRTATIGAAGILIGNLGLLFVPAGVGVGQHLDILQSDGVALGIVILASSAITMIATVWAFLLAKRFFGARA